MTLAQYQASLEAWEQDLREMSRHNDAVEDRLTFESNEIDKRTEDLDAAEAHLRRRIAQFERSEAYLLNRPERIRTLRSREIAVSLREKEIARREHDLDIQLQRQFMSYRSPKAKRFKDIDTQ